MVGYHRESSAGGEQFGGSEQHLAQRVHFVVHFNTQCLKESRHVLFLPLALEKRLHGSQKILRCLYLRLLTCLDERCGYASRVLQFAVDVEDVGELFLVVRVHYLGSGASGALVHAHVERRVEAERESAFGVVEVVRRHAEVGQQTVDVVYLVVAHPVLQVSEVAAYERKAVAGVGNVALGVGVLVETVEVCAVGEPREYLARVPSATEGDIYINAARLDVESVDALAEKHRYMICCCCCRIVSVVLIHYICVFGCKGTQKFAHMVTNLYHFCLNTTFLVRNCSYVKKM